MRAKSLATAVACAALVAGCSASPDTSVTPKPSSASAVDTSSMYGRAGTPATPAPGPTEAPFVAPTKKAPKAATSPHITGQRLCAGSAFDEKAGTCTWGLASWPVRDLHCSANVKTPRYGKVTARFYRDGLPQYETEIDIPKNKKGKKVPLYVSVAAGDMELPGGTWACEMVLPSGQRSTTQDTVASPASPEDPAPEQGTQRQQAAIHLRACTEDDLVDVQEGVAHCAKHQPTIAAGAKKAVCSALFSGVKDRIIKVRVRYSPAADPQSSQVQTLRSSRAGSGLFVSDVRLNPKGFAADEAAVNSPGMPAGDYSCEWLIDGKLAAERDFTIG